MKRNSNQCRLLIEQVAKECNIDYNLISHRLLDFNDKIDMLDGNLNYRDLKAHVMVWKQNGMMDYVNV